ncbi:MAG: hypothetical protein KIT84_13260 [Labilithrix sp.]|nr:hypothetical protein [Labilithrix sp.]MCW5811985.1 hypothetical protein [Labilithrix sp.]
MTRPLFTRFPTGLQTTYSELKQRAQEQETLLLGTPGSVSRRIDGGGRYWYRQFYDAEGAKAAEYIGPVGDEDAERRAEEVRDRIADANALAETTRLLTTVGYIQTDLRTQAVLVVLANAGLFRAGAILIGSHSYGALLNDLGVKSAELKTEDIDIARLDRLNIDGAAAPPFEELLRSSRVPLRPIPSLDRKGPVTSFAIPPRLRGKTRLRVDLLTPASGGEAKPLPVWELGAHAMGLPHLRYLLEDSIPSVVLGKHAVVPVRVPRPERLAWHKTMISQLRHETSDKGRKDLDQAAVLVAVLAEDAPDTLLDGYRSLSAGGRTRVARGVRELEKRLAAAGHVNAVELVRDAVGTRPASKKG